MAPSKRSQQNSHSQPHSAQRQLRNSQEPTTSTRRQTTGFPEEGLDIFVKRCVRYMLIKGGSNAVINEADIKKMVLNRPLAPKLKPVMEEAKKILNEVYGLKAQKSVNTKTQYYFICNRMPPMDPEEEGKVPVDSNRIMLMLVLVHVYMGDNNVTEESILAFLEKMQMESTVRHAIFGKFADFIKNAVKHKYLETTTHNDKIKYKWGLRAEMTISKEELLDFVSMIFNRPPQTWSKSLEAASQQKKILHEDSESDASVESF